MYSRYLIVYVLVAKHESREQFRHATKFAAENRHLFKNKATFNTCTMGQRARHGETSWANTLK